MVNRGIRRDITKTNLLKYVDCTSLWNVKSSTGVRKVARHVSGMQRYIHRNAGHDSRTLWTMKQHRTAAASASEPNAEMREQAVGGSASSSSSGPAPAAGRPAPEDANMEPAESSAQPTSSVVRTMEAEDNTSAKRQKLMAGYADLARD